MTGCIMVPKLERIIKVIKIRKTNGKDYIIKVEEKQRYFVKNNTKKYRNYYM